MSDADADLLQPGDLAQLLSGGPPMTVEQVRNYSGSPAVDCGWFDTTGRYQTREFWPLFLRRYEPDLIPPAAGLPGEGGVHGSRNASGKE